MGTRVGDPRCLRLASKFATTEQDQSGLGGYLLPSVIETRLILAFTAERADTVLVGNLGPYELTPGMFPYGQSLP